LIDDKYILIWVISEKSGKFSSVKEQAFNFMWGDFSHEIPQKFSRLPPQLEKI
jgi:hypothetical protein